jgi:aminopeptidase N
LEQLLGSKERFEQMLRDYIKKYSGKSVMSQDWIQFLKNAFPDKQDVLDKVDFDSWLNKPVGFLKYSLVIEIIKTNE